MDDGEWGREKNKEKKEGGGQSVFHFHNSIFDNIIVSYFSVNSKNSLKKPVPDPVPRDGTGHGIVPSLAVTRIDEPNIRLNLNKEIRQ